MADIFFPTNLSPQGYLTDLILSQVYSSDFTEIRKLLYGRNDLLKRTKGRVFSLDPRLGNVLETSLLPKTPRNPTGDPARDREKMRKYVNFLNDMKPYQIAAMQPYIRMYVKVGESEDKLFKKEIIFRTYTELESGYSTETGGKVFNKQRDLNGGYAGIKSLRVERHFQKFGVTNKYTINMSFYFRDMLTFARGAPLNAIDSLNSFGNKSPFGMDMGSDYVYLIKRLAKENTKEFLFLEYGWKFPDNVSSNIIDKETKQIFEEQEKKELRLICYQHNLGFSQTGELSLDVTYTAEPIASMRLRNEKRTNDAFTIKNDNLITEIFADKGKKQNITKLSKELSKHYKDLSELTKEKEEIAQTGCAKNPTHPDLQKTGKKKEQLDKISVEIERKKRTLLMYIQHAFLRYFISRKQLFFAYMYAFPPNDTSSPHSNQLIIHPYDHPEEQVVLPRGGKQFFKIFEELKEKVESTRRLSRITNEDKQQISEDPKFGPGIEGILKKDLFDLQSALLFSHISEQYEGTKEGAGFGLTYGNFSFFPIKALISAIYEFADSSSSQTGGQSEIKQMPLVCLGNVMHTSLGKEYWANIGDVLVEVGVFQRWIYNEFIRNSIASPTMDQFMEAVIKKLVPMAMSGYKTGHYSSNTLETIVPESYTVTKEYHQGGQKIIDRLGKLHYLDIGEGRDETTTALLDLAKSIKTGTPAKKLKYPLIYYHQDVDEKTDSTKQAKSVFLRKFGKRDRFDVKRDFEDGIYHAYLGQDSGIVQNIDFSYINEPLLNTVLARQNRNSLEPYLRYSYRADITFFGNNLYFGRSAFFAIPANQFKIEKNRDPFGLTGYYRIEKTIDTITPGNYTTTVSAMNMYSPKDNEDKESKKEKVTNTKKCPTIARKEKKEKEIIHYVEHDLAEYMYDLISDVPDVSRTYGIKKHVKQDKKTEQR